LTDFPEIGSRRDALGADLRVVLFKDYVSYYRIIETEVIIVRVLHGRRDMVAIAAEGGFSAKE
jgi:toxin ParE1/3/4